MVCPHHRHPAVRAARGAICVEARRGHRRGASTGTPPGWPYCCRGQPADPHQGSTHPRHREQRLLRMWRRLLRAGPHPRHSQGDRGRPGAADPGVRRHPPDTAGADTRRHLPRHPGHAASWRAQRPQRAGGSGRTRRRRWRWRSWQHSCWRSGSRRTACCPACVMRQPPLRGPGVSRRPSMSPARTSGHMPLSQRTRPSSSGREPPSAPQRTVPTMASAATPKLTPLATGRDLIAARYPNWWTSARCGNLHRGTCILMDFARPLVTHARISLGSASGTGIQVRADPAPIRASPPPIARTAHAVRLRLTTPALGRYRRICPTQHKPDSRGRWQPRRRGS